MAATRRRELMTLTVGALGVAVLGTLFCIVQIHRTAQLPTGDGSGMQWIILTPLSLLFVFLVVPAFVTGLRGIRLLRAKMPAELSQALPGKGWLIALSVLVLYFLAPFIIAPIIDQFTGE